MSYAVRGKSKSLTYHKLDSEIHLSSTYNTYVKVLVTGANGFTGSHLARLLREAGHEVRALVRQTSDLTLLKGIDVERFEGELTNGARLREAVAGVERIFHIAAVYREARLSDDYYRQVNVDGDAPFSAKRRSPKAVSRFCIAARAGFTEKSRRLPTKTLRTTRATSTNKRKSRQSASCSVCTVIAGCPSWCFDR